MRSHRSIRVFTAGMLFAAIAAFGQTAATGSSVPSPPQLPPVGLAPTETAQVNVVTTALPDPNGGGLLPVCSGTIAFYSGGPGSTAVVGIAAFNARSGEVFSAPLSYARTGASGARTVIRVAITLSPFLVPAGAGPVAAPCSLMASLETFDSATGVTHAIVYGATTQDTMSVSQATVAAVR
jgi:hypothetical protein